MRISKITEKTDANSTALVKRYEYTSAAVSQQLLFSKVFQEDRPVSGGNCNVSGRKLYNKLQRYSYNLIPQVKVPIYYREVAEFLQDHNSGQNLGKTEYTFVGASYGSLSGTFSDLVADKPEKIVVKDANGNTVEETVFDYDIIQYNLGNNNKTFFLKRERTDLAVCKFETKNHVTPIELSYSRRTTSEPCIHANSNYVGTELASYTDYWVNKFTRKSFRVRLNSKTHKANYPNTVTTTTTYEYLDKDHNKPFRTKVAVGNGRVNMTEVDYSGDYGIDSPNPIQDLLFDHRIAVPLEVRSYVIDGNNQPELSQTQRTEYKAIGNYIMPDRIDTAKGDNNLETRIVYGSYDNNGNIQEVSKPGGTGIYYIWGYKGTYPLVEIKNFDANQISASLQSIIDQAIALSNLENTESEEIALIAKLEEIRSHSDVSNSQVQYYTYDPGIGVTSFTNPFGDTTHYHYDPMNRLQHVTDAQGNILQYNQYHYKN